MSSPRSRRGILTTIPVSDDGTFGYSVPPPAHCSSAAATLLPFWGTEHKPAPLVLQQGQTIRESIARSLKKEQESKFSNLSVLPSCLPGAQNFSSLGLPILYQQPDHWGIRFYTRIDLKGSFHTYPHVGGPFESLTEVNHAIELYLMGRQEEQMFVGLSGVELAVQKCLYWPDGRRKKHLASQPIDTTRDFNRQLVEALVDKYNEDHNLLGDLAYEFKDIMCCQSIRDSRFYDHINFTAKVKGADDLNCCTDKLFFAEVMYNQSSSELFVICLCVLDSTANGHCYGCHCNGSPDMKHPSSGYMAGHTSNVSGRSSKINCGKFDDEDNEDELEAQKARLRWLFGGSSELKQIRDPHGAER
ncbi:hypothetical protein ACQJBY_009018 [Aegilops geniculata]